MRRPWLLLAHYRGRAPESEVPYPGPQLESVRAWGQAQVCWTLSSSLPLFAATCCVWLLDPWLCSVCSDVTCSWRHPPIQHLLSTYCVPGILESPRSVRWCFWSWELRSIKGSRSLQMRVVCAAANARGFRSARVEGIITSLHSPGRRAGKFCKECFTKRYLRWVLK